jgi:hypothetical protein
MTLWTKDPSDMPTRYQQHKDCAELVRQLGGKVIFRSGTHEKAIIMDEVISYYGSLNPLSHRDTKETMFRIVDRAFAKTLLDHLDLDEDKEKEEPIEDEESQKSRRERVFKKIGLKRLQDGLDEENARKVLRKLRWVIAEDKGLPYFSTLWNETIEWIIEQKPEDIEQLFRCKEFKKNKTNISGYEEILLEIVSIIE